jgi:hypothetical protein
MDRIFTMMSEDPEMGPKLKEANIPQRFEFSDVEMVVNLRSKTDGEDGNIYWEWSDDIDWEPRVKLTMSSDTANRYFQGKENVALALALRKVKASGDIGAALKLAPITEPIFGRYRDLVETDYPHLKL